MNKHEDCHQLILSSKDPRPIASRLQRGPSYQEREIINSSKVVPSRLAPNAGSHDVIGEETGDEVLEIESDATTDSVSDEQESEQRGDASVRDEAKVAVPQIDLNVKSFVEMPPPTVFRDDTSERSCESNFKGIFAFLPLAS